MEVESLPFFGIASVAPGRFADAVAVQNEMHFLEVFWAKTQARYQILGVWIRLRGGLSAWTRRELILKAASSERLRKNRSSCQLL
jgi:hypothetical protein